MEYKMLGQNQNFEKLYLTFQSYFFIGIIFHKGCFMLSTTPTFQTRQ